MNINRNKFQSLIRPIFIFIGVLGLLLLSYGTVAAVRYNIVIDGSTSDWSVIPVYVTDDPEDVATPDEDIINVWVATSDTGSPVNLNFLIQVSGSPATNGTDRGVAAYLDCPDENDNPPNGLFTDEWDRIVVYDKNNSQVGGEASILLFGDKSKGYVYDQSGDYGEIGGAYVEWGVPITELPPDDPGSGGTDNNCRDGDVNIYFATVNTNSQENIDFTDPGGFNIPTVVTMEEMNAKSSIWNADMAYLILGGALVLTGFGGLAIYTKKKNSQ